MEQIIVGILAIWLVLLGMAFVLNQHRPFARASAHLAGRAIRWPFRYAWTHYRTQCVWFVVGIVFCLYLLSLFRGAPTP